MCMQERPRLQKSAGSRWAAAIKGEFELDAFGGVGMKEAEGKRGGESEFSAGVVG